MSAAEWVTVVAGVLTGVFTGTTAWVNLAKHRRETKSETRQAVTWTAEWAAAGKGIRRLVLTHTGTDTAHSARVDVLYTEPPVQELLPEVQDVKPGGMLEVLLQCAWGASGSVQRVTVTWLDSKGREQSCWVAVPPRPVEC